MIDLWCITLYDLRKCLVSTFVKVRSTEQNYFNTELTKRIHSWFDAYFSRCENMFSIDNPLCGNTPQQKQWLTDNFYVVLYLPRNSIRKTSVLLLKLVWINCDHWWFWCLINYVKSLQITYSWFWCKLNHVKSHMISSLLFSLFMHVFIGHGVGVCAPIWSSLAYFWLCWLIDGLWMGLLWII